MLVRFHRVLVGDPGLLMGGEVIVLIVRSCCGLVCVSGLHMAFGSG